MASILRTARSTERLARIGLVLIKHGFGELVSRLPLGPLAPKAEQADGTHRTYAVRLREALVELGPSFVKLGQIASTRRDLLPPDLITELAKLQDAVPPMSEQELDEVLAETLGGGLETRFASFERTPLASASIGQVHAARLRTSEEVPEEIDVVVKLQRPNARATVERDVDLLYMFARLVAEYIPESRVYAPVALVREFDRAITAELDYTIEADNALRFARNFDGDPTVAFPRPYRHVSGKRVLVMERFRGTHIFDFVAAGREGTGGLVARRALMVVVKMVFEHGFFHADPHPGNIIMMGTPEAPIIGLIDLGLIGRLTDDVRDAAISLMIAAVTSDAGALADALLALGKPNNRVDMQAFRAEVAVLSEKYLGRPLAEIEIASLIRDLVQGATKYDIDLPAEMLMMGKALMTIEGIGKQLDPRLDIWSEARPYFAKLLWNRYNPQRLGRDAIRGVRQLGLAASNLPGQVNDVLEDLRSGQLSIRTRDPELAIATDRLGRRLFSAIIFGTLIVAATALVIADADRRLPMVMTVAAGLVLVAHWIGDRRSRVSRT